MSALFGIGGGSLTVPLTWNSVPMRNAVAASAACSMPIALAGSLSYLYAGWGDVDLPEWSVGFIYLPALLASCSPAPSLPVWAPDWHTECHPGGSSRPLPCSCCWWVPNSCSLAEPLARLLKIRRTARDAVESRCIEAGCLFSRRWSYWSSALITRRPGRDRR